MARPIGYDRDEVIDRALAQFWSDGFEGSDVETLTRSSGLNRHSLYKAFGGKEGLFLDALTRYVDRVAAAYVALLDEGEGLDALVAYFDHSTRPGDANKTGGLDGYDQRGCFLTNTVIELGRADNRVAALIDGYYARIERAFAALIARGQANGSIRADFDADVTARWLRLTSQGVAVSARIGAVPGDLAGVVRIALTPSETVKGNG